MKSINPATGKIIKSYDPHTAAEVGQKLQKADKAFVSWSRTSFAERSDILQNAAKVLRARKSALAKHMSEEMGKLIGEAESEVEKCAWVCEFYAEKAEGFLAPEHIKTDASKSMTVCRPLGPVLAVMPWNFPLWQVFRFAAPTLMAGNVGVLKHASNVPGCALDIEDILLEAGLPFGCFQTLLVGSDQVEAIIQNPIIKAVTLTGSTPAGRAVAATAGLSLKKTVLELGGSDPYIILADADLELAADKCTISRMLNAGQSCIAAKRFIVEAPVYDEFIGLFFKKLESFKLGDPAQKETTLGPQAREDLRDELHEQVISSIDKGAKCILGGKIPERSGAFYPATMLIDVKPGMPAYEEELFGPVAAVIKAKDEQDAIRIANDTEFGLGAAVFTQDLVKGERIAADELQAGCCFVNDFVRSDPRLPFGGIKTSGYGRELSKEGIREFVNVKTVYVG
ncbi:MAG: NAD-dependent succinate-semialdehyde dehydrogenase [Bacteroidia bacterium]